MTAPYGEPPAGASLSWRVDPFLKGTSAVHAGDYGWLLVRNEDGQVLRWSRYAPGASPPSEEREPPESYLDESWLAQQASQAVARLGAKNVGSPELRWKPDRRSRLDEALRAWCTVAFVHLDGNPYVGRHRPGVTIGLDPVTGSYTSFNYTPAYQLERGEAAITEEEALSIADECVRAQWHRLGGRRLSHRYGFGVDSSDLAAALEDDKNPFGVDTVTAYWCIEARYDTSDDAWVCVRLSDGAVIDASIGPGGEGTRLRVNGTRLPSKRLPARRARLTGRFGHPSA